MTDTAPPTEVAGRARGKRGYFLPGAIALAALLAIGGAVGAGDLSHPAPRSLAGSDVASEIALGIQTAERLSQPPSVSCPPTEEVGNGLRFTCTEAAGGSRPARTIAVTEIDGRGHLRWSVAPSARP